jgi:hypothetical protein
MEVLVWEADLLDICVIRAASCDQNALKESL